MENKIFQDPNLMMKELNSGKPPLYIISITEKNR